MLDVLAMTAGWLGQVPPVDTAAVQVQSVWDFVVKGGPLMVPIGLASLVALAVIIERTVSLRRRRVIPEALLSGLEKILADPRSSTEQALAFCRENGSPLANILAAGLRRSGEPVERMEKHVEEAGQREVLKLRKFLRALAVIGSIAPLLGLLGTIFGMIRAFQTVASSGEALGRTELLAKGIYEAMITTAAGLLVAIPVLIAYHWIAGRVERRVLEMDQMTVEFIEKHLRKPPGRVVKTARASVDEELVTVGTADEEPIEVAAG